MTGVILLGVFIFFAWFVTLGLKLNLAQMMRAFIAIAAMSQPLCYAGLFGPSNFEECVLDQMKGIKSDAAANAVSYACRKKFPDKSESQIKPYEPIENYLFSGLGSSRPNLNTLINKLEIVRSASIKNQYDNEFRLEIDITNRNDFPIAGIQIGLSKTVGSKCSWDERDFSEIYVCTGTAMAIGSGTFTCQVPRMQNRKINYCVVGLAVRADKTTMLNFMKERGIP